MPGAGKMRLPATLPVAVLVLAAWFASLQVEATRFGHPSSWSRIHRLNWNIVNTYVSRNCYNGHLAVTVDGKFPGPTVEINEGDTVIIHVTNKQHHPVTLHWHGIKQRGSNWADGPEHVTQCPMREGQSYTYEFTVEEQRGTFWWHAHIGWMRATLYGHFIVHPKRPPPNYNSAQIHKEIPIALGTWFAQDPSVLVEAFKYAVSRPIVQDEIFVCTLNGRPGPLASNGSCSSISQEPSTEVIKVKQGKTYLFRLVNVAINLDIHFKIADHQVTVVAADANYVKPFETDVMTIAPGQSYDVLFTANKPGGKYYMAINSALVTRPGGQIQVPVRPNGVAIVEYEGAEQAPGHPAPLSMPDQFSRSEADSFQGKVKSFERYTLPGTVDVHLFYPVGVCVVKCFPFEPCLTGEQLGGTMQNVSFILPNATSLLEAYFYRQEGVYTTDLPDAPPVMENWTDKSAGPNPHYYHGTSGTKLRALNFGETVQVVLQNVNAFGNMVEHPYHLHGHDFYVMGVGYGNYDSVSDAKKLNLVDPPLYNTFSIPQGGWVVLRFQANNPGVWLFHCHFERHAAWNMKMAFVVRNGPGRKQSLQRPVHPLPKCL